MAHAPGESLPVQRRRRVSPAPRTRSPAPSRPEVSVGPIRTPAPRSPRPTGVFAQPIGRVSPVGNAQQRAAQGVRRAARQLPPEHQLPRFPVLRHYTPAQRQVIQQRTVTAVHRIAQQRGLHPTDAANTLMREGDAATRQSLRIFGRVVHEETNAQHSRALHTLLTAQVNPNLNALTEPERLQWRHLGTLLHPVSQEGQLLMARLGTQSQLRRLVGGAKLSEPERARIFRSLTASAPSQLRPGQKTVSGPGAIPLAAIHFALDPNRNAFVPIAGGVSKLVKPVASDVISLPKDVVDSAYYTGAGLVEAAQGRPQRLKQIASALKNHDPIALALQGRWQEAAQAVGQHPLTTVLELGGLRGIPRGIGRIGKLSTERAAAVLPGTALETARTYSRDPLMRAVERRVEQARVNRAQRLYREAQQAEHSGLVPQEHADELYRRAAEADPRLMTGHQVEHRADVAEALAQPAKRRGRAEVKAKLEPLTEAPRHGGHLQRLIAEAQAPVRYHEGPLGPGSVNVEALRRDLGSYHDSLVQEATGLRGGRLAANKRLRARIQEGLRLPDEQLAKLADNSRQIAEITNAQEARNITLGQLDPREALIARVKTYAVRHMGAQVRVASDKLERWRENPQGKPPDPQLVRAETKTYTPRQAAARAVALEEAAKAPGLPGALRGQLRSEAQRVRLTRSEHVYTPLPPEDVLAHMKAQGVNPEHVAFVTQRPGSLGAGAYNVRALPADLTRKGLPTRTRTGHAVIQGLIDTHPSRLTANVVRLQQLEAADRNYVNAFHEVAARDPSGMLRVFTNPAKGRQFIERSMYDEHGNRIHGAPKMRLIRINPWGGRESQLKALVEHGDPEGFLKQGSAVDHPISRAIEEAVGENALQGNGPWAAVPEDWARRVAEHAQVYRSSSPTLRAVTMMFRNTVLPLSLPWLTGNVSEAALRAAIKSPRVIHNIATFRRVLHAVDQMDPQEGAVLRDQLGVGHFGMSEVSNTHLAATQFAGSRIEPIARALAVVRHTPGPKQIADLYAKYTHWVFHSVNQMLEQPFREAMAGHHIRQVFGDPGSIGRISQQAVEDAARGLRGSNAQVRLADEVRRAYGQYEAFSPRQRKFVVLYSPFMAWSLNAVRFIGSVLPKDHPVLTALLAADNRVSGDWRKQHGLVEGGFLGGANPVPDFLMGSIPVGGGGHVNPTRYTPFGAFGNPAGNAADLILPQFSGALHALQGQKWTGQPLKQHGSVSTPERIYAAVGQELASFVPFFGRVQQAIGYQGSVPSRIFQTENPLKVVKKRTSSAKQRAVPAGQTSGGVDWSAAARGSAVSSSGGIDWSAAARSK